MAKLIMMRHGQSEWNLSNLFTGWVDVPLSKNGIEEAFKGASLIKELPIDVIFMSSLIRSQMTAMLVMAVHSSENVPIIIHQGEGKLEEWSTIYSEETKRKTIPTFVAWQLNERMYGQLQGLNKQETIEQYGAEQVKLWRRSYDTAPPGGESLEMTAARAIPYFKEKIIPFLDQEKNVFISAHGNSLRAIVMSIENLSKAEVLQLELATGAPFLYEYHSGTFGKANCG